MTVPNTAATAAVVEPDNRNKKVILKIWLHLLIAQGK